MQFLPRFVATLTLAAIAGAQAVENQYPRLVEISFDPILASHGGQRLHDYMGWYDPTTEIVDYLDGMKQGSHGIVDERCTQLLEVNFWPIKADGFQYTESQYLAGNWHFPDGVDYVAFIRDYDLARKCDRGEIDEAAINGAPYFGYWESTMAGLGGYYCNSGPQQFVPCSKIFVVMGWNYERIVSLHATAHRAESIMTYVYGGWSTNRNLHLWDRFGWNLGQTTISSIYGVGSAHYPPNATADYQYSNSTLVPSYAPDWLNNFPNLTGQSAQVSRYTWGATPNSYEMAFFIWWYQHMPHVAGRNQSDGYDRLNNWWEYTFDFNEHPESGGEHVVGVGTPLAATAHPGTPAALTADNRDDWAPEINDAGRLVWYGSDGHDFEIYSSDADGGGLVQITSNAGDDQAPQINAAGQLVWQAFDGLDFEIYTANADGTNVVRVTNNAVNDWHPDISDGGRIVWDAWDGEDYEIWSADVDGSNLVQLSSNSHGGSGLRRDDVWPRINASGRVVWSGYAGNYWQIYSADANGANPVQLTTDSFRSEYPEIGDDGTVVWQAWLNAGSTEVFRANASGGTVEQLTFNSYHDWWPRVNAAGDVVWMQRPGSDWEIVVREAGSPLFAYVTTNNTTHQQYPRIDDAGRIVWQGFDGSDWEIYALEHGTIYQVTDNDFDDRWPCPSAGGEIAWHGESTPGTGGDTTEIWVLGAEPGQGFCFGDPGSGTPCPCSNDNDGSVPGSGCANGVFSSGARLTGRGAASVSGDTLVLATSGLEPNNTGLYFQANNLVNGGDGNPFGDGLRCAGGALVRLQIRVANGNGESQTSLAIAAQGGAGAGDTKRYQCWYRTSQNPPCGVGVHDFNLSNGYEVVWGP